MFTLKFNLQYSQSPVVKFSEKKLIKDNEDLFSLVKEIVPDVFNLGPINSDNILDFVTITINGNCATLPIEDNATIEVKSTGSDVVSEYLDFISHHRKSQWHSARYIRKMLEPVNAIKISSDVDFSTLQHDKFYFFELNEGTSIISFYVPKENTGRIVGTGAHSDIPCYVAKPTIPATQGKYTILPIEPYGGLLPYSWLNRDLGIAGRILVNSNGKIEQRLVEIDSIATIPGIAPHLGVGTPAEKVAPDTNPDRMTPLLSVNGTPETFCRLLAGESEILGGDLRLFDMEEPSVFGMEKEFIHAQGHDDGICCYTLTKAFINAAVKSNDISLLCLFDNEEIGSETAYGANSRIVSSLVQNLENGFNMKVLIGESIFFSCDVDHANFHEDKVDQWCTSTHGKGVTISTNAKQANISSGVTTAIIKSVAQKTGVNVQVQSRRNNIAGGGTLARYIASDSLMRTCDLGVILTSMHSIREIAHVADMKSMIELGEALYINATNEMASISFV